MHILVIDDHPILLDGTKALLESVDGWRVTAISDIAAALETTLALTPDLVLLDINLGDVNGISLAQQIKAAYNVPIILYSGYDMEDFYELLLQQAVDGLLSKTATKDVVLATVEATLRGDIYVPRSFLKFVAKHHSAPTEATLSEREITVLTLVARGETNKAIAAELGLSQRTVEHTLTKIFTTLDVDSRAEAVVKAKDLRLMP